MSFSRNMRRVNPAPNKYSYRMEFNDAERALVKRLRAEFKLPEHVYDEMIHRQLTYCKDTRMSIETAKAHILKTYVDDINGNVNQATKDINKTVIEGARGVLNRKNP